MKTAVNILIIAAGGALGSVARYLIGLSPAKDIFDKFPFPTFLINISGSFLIGFVTFLFTERYAVSENIRLAFIVGFLGAYTTFSTFESETWTLLKEGNHVTALGYVILSVALGFIALVAGIELAKRLG
jgi:CrcB protein